MATVPNRVASMFVNFDFPIAPPLFYSVLIMSARLFGPELLFGTLEYSGVFYELALTYLGLFSPC